MIPAIEALESRTYFAAVPNMVASANRLMYSQPEGEVSRAQWVTLKNTGSGKLSLKSISITGPDATRFTLDRRRVPTSLAAGASASMKIYFHPLDAGVRGAVLKVATNDPHTPLLQVALRGLGTIGYYWTAEPSLQRILDTFQIPVNVGDKDPATDALDGPGPSDERLMPLLKKAGPGPVRMGLLAVFSFESSPIARFGWYGQGASQTQHELFVTPAGNSQTIAPTITGVTTFDPGAATFGVYTTFPHQPHGPVFSEDGLNTWDTVGGGHKMRFYPYKRANGTIMANAYVVGVDEAINNIDFQDAVFIINNVVLGGVSAAVARPFASAPVTTAFQSNDIPPALPGTTAAQGATATGSWLSCRTRTILDGGEILVSA